MTTTARCLSTLEALPEEGYSQAAQRRLAGSRQKFPHRIDQRRDELITFRTQAIQRLSIPGVQDKLSLRLRRGKLEPIDHDGEYILKPIPTTVLPRFPGEVPANEHLTMQIANQVFGIETPPNACIRLGNGELAYIVKRFDRRENGKIPQEDFCQLMQRSPATHGNEFKYGASYEELAVLLKKYCPAYRIEIERLFSRLVFCYAFSNGDAHLKNFSLYATKDTGDHVLTPAYDLVCTSLHLPDESRLALDLFLDAHETRSFQENGFHTGECFHELGRRCGIPEERIRKLMSPFIQGSRQAESLIERSFLSDEARKDYLGRYRDRLRALQLV